VKQFLQQVQFYHVVYKFSVRKRAVDPFSFLCAVDDSAVFQYLDVMGEVWLCHVEAYHQFAYAHLFNPQQFHYSEPFFVR